jgi:hypothetical protein
MVVVQKAHKITFSTKDIVEAVALMIKDELGQGKALRDGVLDRILQLPPLQYEIVVSENDFKETRQENT